MCGVWSTDLRISGGGKTEPRVQSVALGEELAAGDLAVLEPPALPAGALPAAPRPTRPIALVFCVFLSFSSFFPPPPPFLRAFFISCFSVVFLLLVFWGALGGVGGSAGLP